MIGSKKNLQQYNFFKMKLNEFAENIDIFNKDGNSRNELYQNSIDFLQNNKLPNPKNELWKYTPVSGLNTIDFTLEFRKDIDEWTIEALKKITDIPADTITIPILNGKLLNELVSINNNFTISTNKISKLDSDGTNYHLSQSVDSDYFYNLNTLLNPDEICLKINRKSENLNFLFLLISQSDSNLFISPRLRVELQENANAKIAYKFINLSHNEIISNLFTEVVLKQNANLDFYLLQDNLTQFQSVNNINVIQDRDSRFTSNTYTKDSKFIRNFLRIYLAGENSEANLNGLFIGNANDLIDNHILIEHIKPNCYSNQIYKGILNNNSVGVFNGAVLVHPNAQKTNAYQSNRNILTSDSAKVYTKPELEIYADDVKCSHGEATGFVDDEMLYYMRTRGLSEENAHKLLLQAFAVDVINKFQWGDIKDSIINQIAEAI